MISIVSKYIAVVMFAAAALRPSAWAQSAASQTVLKVEIVISRYEGSGNPQKKVSSLPYELTVLANDKTASLRMGSQFPMTTKDGTFQYVDIGTNIDCVAKTADDGRFKLDVTINDRSANQRRSSEGQAPGVPELRNFQTNNVLMLRDGQSTQFTAATDKTSGEVVKVEVTLKVEK